MNVSDRLQARAFQMDELYFRATKAERERDQALAEVKRYGVAIGHLVAEESETEEVRWAIGRALATP